MALENRFDLLVLDGSPDILVPWSGLASPPDLTILRDALAILRRMNREEEIALVYFGGLRTGTDAAKILALNCQGAAFGTALGLAMGGRIDGGRIVFGNDATVESMGDAAVNWIRAAAQETAIIARCTGKTNVHNLEPEDMRTITLATSTALDIPLASGRERRERF